MRHHGASSIPSLSLLSLAIAAGIPGCGSGSGPADGTAPAAKATPEGEPESAPADPAEDPAQPKPPEKPDAPAPPIAIDDEPMPDTPPPVPTAEPEIVTEVARGFNTFGLELYAKVGTDPGDLVISPASIALAIAMTQAGARGETGKEMADALHYPRAAPVVQRSVATMLGEWNEPREGFELAVANRLFGDAKVPYEPPYLSLTERFFGAPLEPVDFRGAHEAARARINSWVEERTHDRIKDLLPPNAVDSSTRLVLVNAIYFKSPWLHPFTEGLTAPAPFFAAAGTHDVPTMRVTERLAVAQTDDAQIIELAYVDPRYSMTVVVPTAVDGLAAIEAGLSVEALEGWHTATKGERISLSLPKFRIAPDDAMRLSGPLRELGIRTAFTSAADLTGIAPASEQLMLSEAFHKGFIEVDEKGTEAAAATAMAARAGSAAPIEEPREVKVDRPFLYFIRDTSSGLVLFMGRVTDPKTEA